MITYSIQPIHIGYAHSFPDWISLLTLCLAPLIAHIISGIPHASYLCTTRPRWHERIFQYNPTSIIWRYFSIIDRRLRARNWSRADLAAANALFWTSKGWEGSEHMVTQSLPHCIHLPASAHADIFSDESFKSIVTALQGVQAAYLIVLSYSSTWFIEVQFLGADRIFYPLAVFGLLRLSAAPWLSSDFKYTCRIDFHPAPTYNEPNESADHRMSVDSLIQVSCDKTSVTEQYNYRPTSCWHSWILRILYMTILLGLWSLPFLWVFPIPYSGVADRYFTATTFLAAIVYLILMSVSVAVHAYYFIQGQTTSTIIPCASHTWYKVYTVLLFAAMAAMSIVSLLETTKSICGKYTSIAPLDADLFCETTTVGVEKFDTQLNGSDVLGLALRYPYVARGTVLKKGEFWLRNFSGTCIGGWTSELRVHAMALNDVVDFTGLVDWGNGTVTEP